MYEDKELYINEIRPDIYLLDEAHEATGFVVIGKDKACVIDTMISYTDVKKAVKSITDKPLMVINTHGHPDHIYGNIFFDEAYINPKDIPLTEDFVKEPKFIEGCEMRGLTMPPFKEIKGGDSIDLGGRTLEVYDIPGHTPGGILLHLKEDRILFTGDAINHHLWLQLPHSLPLKECAEAIDRVLFLENEADIILHGHARDYDDISLMRCVRDGIWEIINGKTQEDKPYPWFGGQAMQHPFRVCEGKHYQQDDHVICYDPEKQR